MTDLTKPQARVLTRLGDFPDGATIDRLGCVWIGELANDAGATLRLVAKGLVSGRNGRLYITGHGRKVLDRFEYE